jgi:DNA repair protein RadA/Sms
MAKDRTVFQCGECGGSSPKWLGQCPHCKAWNTLVETVAEGTGTRHRFQALTKTQPVATLSEIEATDVDRAPTGIDELDRVLGGGLVAGGVVLIGGDPGIGKSTLLLQALDALSRQVKTLYVTGEESGAQVALRARRLGLGGSAVRVLAEIQLEKIQAAIEAERPAVCVVDSIQTVYSDQLTSAPGSVAQVRECAAQLTRLAKSGGTTIVLVGHVTKEGAIAGPRVLEHIVDTVLYFEGDTHSSFRLVRAIKNRFGAVNEIGVFAMTERGLKGVANPSAIFLSTHGQPVPGSCVLVTLEGTRPLLVEIQALVDSGGPSPRRLSVGLDRDRLAMLLAVLHRHAGVSCMDQDVFVNAVGGVRISEPAADLAVLLAIQGSLRGRLAAARLLRLRRGGAGGRGPARAARAGAAEGGGQAGLRRRAGAGGQRAEEGHRGPDHPRRRTRGAGGGPGEESLNPWIGWALAAVATALAWVQYGWQGLALAGSMIVFWLLLQFSRALRAMKLAGQAPVGHVPSAVMLNAKLKPGMTLLQVIQHTRSLGRRASPEGEQPERWEWCDDGGVRIALELRAGKLQRWELQRPAE